MSDSAAEDDESQRSRLPRWIRVAVLALSVLGALRVLIFAAAYPVFDYIDEGQHIDAVLAYARTGLPAWGDEYYDPEGAYFLAREGMWHSAPSYVAPHDLLSPEARDAAIGRERDRLVRCRNSETFAPPLYYALGAGWYRLGKLIGLTDLARVYWLRFLSAPLYGLTIWFACRLCLRCHPQRPQLAVGVGLILAVLPQDILYTINSDVMSPLAGTVALYLLVRWLTSPGRAMGLAAAAGVAASCAMLVKYSNVGALAAVGAGALVALLRRRRRAEIAVLLLCTAIPLGAWMIRCKMTFGDFTATADKAKQLDWTVLPLAQSLKHPIFTPVGAQDFLSRLCVTFWRGELVWNHSVQRVRAADWFYYAVSVLGTLGVAGWLLRPSPQGRPERLLAFVYFAAVAGSVLFLALVSTRWDYGHCFFPSRGFPYFAAGRSLTGMMTPIAILLVGGAEELLRPRRFSFGLALAVVFAIVSMTSELYLTTTTTGPGTVSVFGSTHNWYHLYLVR